MQLVSFDIFRTLGLPNPLILKAQNFYQYKDQLQQADWVLFPEYWQLNALVYGLGCRLFPSHATYLVGHNKTEMTRTTLACFPQHVPHTVIRANDDENRESVWREMDRPFVAKLNKSSMGNGVWLIETMDDWNRYCALSDILFVQEYLPIDRDLRVVLVGDKIVDCYWRLQAAQGFYNNVAQGGQVDRSQPIPDQAIQLSLDIANCLGINYAGFDIAMIGGHPYLLEFNRLFGTRGIIGGQASINQALLAYLQEHLHHPYPTHPPAKPPIRRVA